METKEVKSTFTLPQEIVIVKHIPRKKGMAANVEKDHVISGGMLSTAVKKFRVPRLKNGGLKNVLTNEEKEFLEAATGLNLSIYGDFWYDYAVTLHKDDANNRFDLSNPMDYISIKILETLSGDEIAPSWEARLKNQTYQFAISRGDDEMLEDKRKYDSKKDAFKLYGKIEDDKDKLLGVLKLLTNKPISKDSTLKWLQHKVEEFIDTMPSVFVNVINDKAFYTKILINSAIEAGVIEQRSNRYRTADGLDLCNSGEVATFENAVAYLDNPKNQEIRTIIEAKISKVK